MSRSIIGLFELEEEPEKEDEVMREGDEEVEEVVDVADRTRRTERLKKALPMLAHLWWQDSLFIDEAAEKLADGARDAKWRVPLGDSGILNFFLGISITNTLRHSFKLQILRLIGNSCADTDENRERVVSANYMPTIISQLQDDTLLAFVIPVLYNVCVDYVPAQQAASKSHLSTELTTLISSPRFKGSMHFLGYICKIFEMLIQQPSEPDLAPENTPIVLLNDANDSQLLHAALGFLKNLALPLKNKEILGASGLFDVLPRLWLLDILQPIQLSSISLTRQLLNGWMDNVHRICQRLTPDTDSPAHDRSKLSLLIALFDRTDVEPIRMEIARLITAVCRVFTAWKGLPQEELNSMRARFLQRHPDLGRPLSFMVSQTKWPIVRSEGWFTFAIMARYPDSAQCISDMMQDVSVFQPLVELLTGKPLLDYQETSPLATTAQNQTPTPDPNPFVEPQSPEPVMPEAQAAEMARIDRENALVLVSELLKNRGSEMAVMRRTLFEDLLKGGGELVMSYREAKAENGQGVWKDDVKHRANLNFSGILEESVEELS
ncbi:GTP binding protein [Rutstroemia sp. NJR-2017a BBW]|nr:GTP binding protein [Rutstroemia sp. NJR-2017a BBW]